MSWGKDKDGLWQKGATPPGIEIEGFNLKAVGLALFVIVLTITAVMLETHRDPGPKAEPWPGLSIMGAIFAALFVLVGLFVAIFIIQAISVAVARRWHEYGVQRQRDAAETERLTLSNGTAHLAEVLSAAHISADGALVRMIPGRGWQVVNLSAEVGPIVMADNGSVQRALQDDLSVAQIASHFDVRREDARSKAFPSLHTYHQRSDGGKQALPEPGEQKVLLPDVVRLRDLAPVPSLEHLVLGVTTGNEVVSAPLSSLVHFVAGGRPGSGKSGFLRMLAYQLAMATEDCQLALVDLEGVTFDAFAKSERLMWPIADTRGGAVAIAEQLQVEMARRKELYLSFPGVDNLPAYNAQAEEPLLPIILLMDEATALMVDHNGVMGAVRDLAFRARKFGIWLGLGGQSWASKHIDTGIRDMLAARFMFRSSPSQSRMLIGESTASTIEVPGRAYAELPQRGVIPLQVPLIEPREILFALQGQHGPQHELPEEQDDEIDAKIRTLRAENPGMSLREIERQVWGKDRGGPYYQRVKRALAE